MRFQETALMAAASVGDEEIVRLLLSHSPDKIDVNLTVLKDCGRGASGQTALQKALDRGCIGIVRILLERDEIDIYSERKAGALSHLSRRHNCNDILRFCFERSKINTGTRYFMNVIKNATQYKNMDALRHFSISAPVTASRTFKQHCCLPKAIRI